MFYIFNIIFNIYNIYLIFNIRSIILLKKVSTHKISRSSGRNQKSKYFLTIREPFLIFNMVQVLKVTKESLAGVAVDP